MLRAVMGTSDLVGAIGSVRAPDTSHPPADPSVVDAARSTATGARSAMV